MKQPNLICLLACAFATSLAIAQDHPTLHIGDPAPAFRVGKWYKGTPVSGIEKGKVYVVDFWATGCGPCVAAIPHISQLAKRYRGAVTFMGISVQKWQDGSQNDTPKMVEAFLRTPRGEGMHYGVAVDTPKGFMVKNWFAAAGFSWIPNSFVVGKDGNIAWMGDPKDLDTVLPRLLKHSS